MIKIEGTEDPQLRELIEDLIVKTLVDWPEIMVVVRLGYEFVNEEQSGSCFERSGVYFVMIRECADGVAVANTLCHELIHVKQFLEKRLKRKSRCIWFEDKKYDWDLAYKERPWEIEAFDQQLTILEKYLRVCEQRHFNYLLSEAFRYDTSSCNI